MNESPLNTNDKPKWNWDEVKKEVSTLFEPAEVQMIQYYLEDFGHHLTKESIIKSLRNNVPIQYIVGHAYFHKYHFKVNSYTLIPRPETEELCQLILDQFHNERLSLCDIGTGSGCILNTLLSERSNWTGTGIDISKEAINCASENELYWKNNDRAEWKTQDILKSTALPKAEIIISNPPYIPQKEHVNMDERVVSFEPKEALFIPDENPLLFYQKITQLFIESPHSTHLFFECHQELIHECFQFIKAQGLAVKKIEDLSQNPRFLYVNKSDLFR